MHAALWVTSLNNPTSINSENDPLTGEEGWSVAESFVAGLGPLSSLFTAAIRAVRSAPMILHTDDSDRIRKFSVEAVNFPVKVSPTFKAALYALAEEIDEPALALAMPLTQSKLLGLFSPDEMIAVIALTYMYRLMRRRCDESEWDRVMPKMNTHMKIGYHVGKVLDGVGSGHGMLIGGMRYIALSILLNSDIKAFKELRRKVESKGGLFDLSEESARWGCNHMQVASCLVSSLGYGVAPRLAFGMSPRSKIFAPIQAAIAESQEEINAWRLAIDYTESLHAFGKAPDYVQDGSNNYIQVDVSEKLEKKISGFVAKGASFQWINRGVEQVPQHVRDQLAIKLKKEPGGEKSSQGAIESDDGDKA